MENKNEKSNKSEYMKQYYNKDKKAFIEKYNYVNNYDIRNAQLTKFHKKEHCKSKKHLLASELYNLKLQLRNLSMTN